jgi:hypothetical protein
MPQSILMFDFGANEDAAQQARHKVEAWKQGFRLGNKMLLKFDREETAAEKPSAPEPEPAEPPKPAAGAAKGTKKKAAGKVAAKPGRKASAKAERRARRGERQSSAARAPQFLGSRKTIASALARPHSRGGAVQIGRLSNHSSRRSGVSENRRAF